MSIKLYDSELKVMEVLWSQGDKTAREIAALLHAETGWNVNTTYTVIKKCVAKGAEAEELLGKLFDGSPDLLFASLLDNRRLSPEQLRRLSERIAQAEREGEL